MPTVADVVDAVVAVDTHADTHTVVLAGPAGVVLGSAVFEASDAGHQLLIAWVFEHAPGPRLLAAVEGTASYGRRLTRALSAVDLPVLELERPTRAERRGRGKTDQIDAALGVRRALALDADRLPTPRADGPREALRLLVIARRDMTDDLTAKTNTLVHLLRTGPDSDHALARTRLTLTELRELAARIPDPDATVTDLTRTGELARLASAAVTLREALTQNKSAIVDLLHQLAPALTDTVGIGPVSAAVAVLAYSHPGRIHSEAAFAALAGVSPLPASSGRTVRHRLNRGGDRQLNRALHTIAVTRMRICPRTQAYVARRQAQGRTPREIRRCLKRYIARELYKTLAHTMTTARQG